MGRFGGRSRTGEVLRGVELGGRVIAITGTSSGIGFETARALAAAGARVYCGARTSEKAHRVLTQIRAAHAEADVHPFVADLASLASCEEAMQGFDAPELHAFIANAGVSPGAYAQTEDGFERTVGVCHYGHAALLRGVRGRMVAGARVVMVASHSHRGVRRFDPDRPSLESHEWSMLGAYDRAKLCNVLYAAAFDRRFREQGVRANSVHPGNLVSTALGRTSRMISLAQWAYRPFAKSLDQAAATSVWAAVHPDLENVGGEYLVDCRVNRASALGRDGALADQLWDHTEAALSGGRG